MIKNWQKRGKKGMRILIDTNILLDYIVEREPYAEFARKIVWLCKENKLEGCIAAHSIPNIFYILRKNYSINERRELLLGICKIFNVQCLDILKIKSALKDTEFSDFEDCLQMECAKAFNAQYIVTRNPRDFKTSVIPCINPDEFISKLQ